MTLVGAMAEDAEQSGAGNRLKYHASSDVMDLMTSRDDHLNAEVIYQVLKNEEMLKDEPRIH